jgi:glycosyltransferase involved in cell wall biosynthesis
MDALSRGMERRIDKSSFYLKPFLKTEARRLKIYEHDIFSFFDNKIIISEQDRNLIVHPLNNKIKIIENGVDFENFKPLKDVKKKYDIIFSGNMSYPPNIDAAKYLVKHIMPNIWKIKKEVRLVIAGANPTKEIINLKSNKVEITGWVDNMNEYYNASKIFVAPMQLGSGLQNKLLEAMAVKLPCITSTLANNALDAENNREILIANNKEEYTNCILQLLEDSTFYNTIASNGYNYILANYSWKNATKKISQLIEEN